MICKYDDHIREAVKRHMPAKYDWRMYKAQLMAESSLQPDATSPVGAMGIAQIMPDTWDQYGNGGDPYDPRQSIYAGARYMASLYDQWTWQRPDIDRVCLAMSSYNAGLGNILEAQHRSGMQSLYGEIIAYLPDVTGQHSQETINYVYRILTFYAQEVTRHA